MATGSWIILKDRETTNPLFGGSEIYCFATEVAFAGKANFSGQPRVTPDTSYTAADNNTVGSIWDRIKTYSSLNSIERTQITVKGNWVEEVGSMLGTRQILTPFKLLKMAISGHSFYLKTGIVIPNLIEGEPTNPSGNSEFFYSSNGMPVFIAGWNMKENYGAGTNLADWSLTLSEDKEN